VYQWVVFAVSELEGPLFRWISELGEGAIDSPAHDRFADAAAAMQSVLAEHDWLVDDRFSVADVMCASVLQGANARGLLGPWPALEAYVQRGEARPAYARAAAISDRPRS
jgi:glutathione S-transferase